MAAENHIVNYDGAVKNLNGTLKSHVSVMSEVVQKYNEWVLPKIPSEYINQLNQVAKSYEKINKSQKDVIDSTVREERARKAKADADRAEANASKAKLLQLQAEERQRSRNASAVDRAVQKALEESRAYRRLQDEWRKAQATYADFYTLYGRQNQATIKARQEFDKLDKKIREVDAATKNYSKNVGNYSSAFNGLGNLTGQLAGALGWAGALYTAVNIGKSIYKTTKELDVLHKAMQMGSKDSSTYASNIELLDKITEQYGLELISTSEAYNKFYIASKNKLALNDIQTIFEKVSKSASLMGLSVDQQKGIFLALEQMMSKGTVQSEELRMQLGDRLPGAFEIMAKAVGVSTSELGDMMKEGKVIASEVLPKFAIELEKAFGADKIERVENLAAAENRASNAWTKFVDGLNSGNGVISKTIIGFMDLTSGILTTVTAKEKLSDSILKEQTQLSMLIGKITSLNEGNTKREDLISQLKTSYPGFISLIENEDFTNANLLSTLNKVNQSYRDRIRLQKQVEELDKLSDVRDTYAGGAIDVENKLMESIIKIQNKYNHNFKISQENLVKSANDYISIFGGQMSYFELRNLKLLKNNVDMFQKAEKDYNNLIDKQKSKIEETKKETGKRTEAEEKSIKNIKDYNEALNEAVITAKKLGGKAGKDFSDMNLESVNAYIAKVKGITGESDKERKAREAAERKAAQALKKLTKEQIESQYDLKKSTLEKEKAQAESSKNTALFYQKEQELANADLEKKNKLADIEISDKKSRDDKKLANFQEYIAKIIELNNKELKSLDDKTEKEKKKNEERLKSQEEFWKKIKDLATKARQQQYDLESISIESQQLDTKQGSKAYYDLEKKKLDEWINLQRDTLKAGSKELEIANAEYELKLKQLNKTIEEGLKDTLKGFLSETFDGLGFGSISMLFDDQLKNMWDNTESTTAKMAIAFKVFGSIVGDVFNQIKAKSDAYFDNQYQSLEKEKEVALKYAGENTAGREAIEEQYNQRRLQLKRQQAKEEKEMAIFQAMINIATGVTSALAQAPPYSFILAALVGALGAVQIASIASQPLPQFYKGTDNAPEGWAIVDELRPEVHTDKHGNPKSFGSTKGANLRYLEKGDKIFKSHSDFFREMSGSYIDSSGSIHIQNNGISKDEMLDVMSRTLGSQSRTETVIDENGFNSFVVNGQSKTKWRNRRGKYTK